MTARSPVSSVKDFLRVLEQSGLAPPELLAKLRARTDAGDARAVARELVQGGVLTRWQAGQLLHGFAALAIGKYRLLEQLESGPWGRAYLAEHMPMGRRHVLRVLSREWAAQPQRVAQFLEAARQASRLDHPHLCHVYDVSQEGDRPYIVLEHVEGQTLLRRVEQGGPLAVVEAVAVAAQIAAGLAHAHEHGVFHPGLDPSRVVGDAAGMVKVVGLGDLRAISVGPSSSQAEANETPAEGQASVSEATRSAAGASETGETGGGETAPAASPLWVMQSPQRRAGQAPSAADDVYALGSTLVFLLAGRAVEDADQAGSVLSERGGIPDELVALCRRMMAALPAERPASMAAVRTELEELAGKLAQQASQPGAMPHETAVVVPLADEPGATAASTTLEGLKSLPVAKPLPTEETIPVLAGSKPARADDALPALAISPPAKGGKKQAATAADRPAPSPKCPADDARPAAAPVVHLTLSRRTLIAAAAAAAILLVALGGVGYWLLAGRHGTVVAQAPAATAKPNSPAATTPAHEESNPTIVGETNPILPEAASDTSGSSASPAAAALPAAGRAISPAEPSSPAANSPAEPRVDPAKPAAEAAGTAPPADSGAKTAGPASPATASSTPAGDAPAQPPAGSEQVAKTDTKSDAKPETPTAKPASPPPAAKPAPKAAAKPAPKPRPFDGLPKAVDLPPTPAMGESAEGIAPVVFGPCRVDEQATLLITLAGGAAATRNPKQSFELAPQASSGRHWDVMLLGESPQKLATLAIEQGQLTFAWQSELGMLAGTARLLSNCALILQTGDARHVLALRKPVVGEPLRIDLDKPASVRWTISDLPPARQLQLIVTRIEGVKDIRKEPAEPVAPGTALSVWLGPSDKWFPLGLRLTSSVNNRGASVSFQPQIKVQGFSEPRPYRRKEIPALQQQAATELEVATKGLEQAKRDRPSTNPIKGPIEKELIEKRKTLFTEQLNNVTVAIEQLAYIAQFMETTQGEAKIHFRISYLADDVPIDLLITEEAPPPPAGKK